MTGIPQAAINAAALEIHRSDCDPDCEGCSLGHPSMTDCKQAAAKALEAAAPHIAAAERQRIADTIRRHMTGVWLSSWAAGWLDAATWIEQHMPETDQPAEPVGADAEPGELGTIHDGEHEI